jgi:SAM-dependent methyltransferase
MDGSMHKLGRIDTEGARTKRYIPALRYEWLTGLYDRVVGLTLPEQRFKRALIAQAGIRAGHHVLDFGSGTATLSLMAKMQVPQAHIAGIDIDPRVLAIARRKVAAAGVPIDLDSYDGASLSYPDHHFDRVISSLVFHHLTPQQKDRALREIRRVLKPGGELHIADWGKARGVAMRLLFVLVQLLDGFATTADNVAGLLPGYLGRAGFIAIQETRTFATIFGTLSLYQGHTSSDHRHS